ncbi:hypothetical protein CRENBAI_005539 [Crenichthys baileyi]|uniref:Uncharacterized protein n=1 Tax=Crenichthys baileyi TaxID=28760 RepID=A0AAV9QVT6_9TELE
MALFGLKAGDSTSGKQPVALLHLPALKAYLQLGGGRLLSFCSSNPQRRWIPQPIADSTAATEHIPVFFDEGVQGSIVTLRSSIKGSPGFHAGLQGSIKGSCPPPSKVLVSLPLVSKVLASPSLFSKVPESLPWFSTVLVPQISRASSWPSC